MHIWGDYMKTELATFEVTKISNPLNAKHDKYLTRVLEVVLRYATYWITCSLYEHLSAPGHDRSCSPSDSMERLVWSQLGFSKNRVLRSDDIFIYLIGPDFHELLLGHLQASALEA